MLIMRIMWNLDNAYYVNYVDCVGRLDPVSAVNMVQCLT